MNTTNMYLIKDMEDELKEKLEILEEYRDELLELPESANDIRSMLRTMRENGNVTHLHIYARHYLSMCIYLVEHTDVFSGLDEYKNQILKNHRQSEAERGKA